MYRTQSSRFVGGGLVWLAMVLALTAPVLAGGAPGEYSATVTTGAPVAIPDSSHDCNDPLNPITNCGFESGLTGWGSEDVDIPFFALTVGPAGTNLGFGLFTSAPTEGTMSVQHGFDGDGATGSVGTIRVWQDVSLPPNTGDLVFDYRAGWDTTFGATLDRTFRVDVEPSGGGTALQTDVLLTAPANTTVGDNGLMEGVVNLSSFSNSDVRISFEWDIPEDLTGPAFFELDNVLVGVLPPPDIEIPTLSGVGLFGMILLLGGVSLLLIVKRRRA